MTVLSRVDRFMTVLSRAMYDCIK